MQLENHLRTPPMPSPIRIRSIATKCIFAMGGVRIVQTTLIATEKNMTHFALTNSAIRPPGNCATMYPQKYELSIAPCNGSDHVNGPFCKKNKTFIL